MNVAVNKGLQIERIRKRLCFFKQLLLSLMVACAVNDAGGITSMDDYDDSRKLFD